MLQYIFFWRGRFNTPVRLSHRWHPVFFSDSLARRPPTGPVHATAFRMGSRTRLSTTLLPPRHTGHEAIGTVHCCFWHHFLPCQPDAGTRCSLYVSLVSSLLSRDSFSLSGSIRQGSKEPIRRSDREGGRVTPLAHSYTRAKTSALTLARYQW